MTDVALLTLAFASASGQKPLTLPYTVTRRVIMQKARRQALRLLLRINPQDGHSPPTACKYTVSRSISLP